MRSHESTYRIVRQDRRITAVDSVPREVALAWLDDQPADWFVESPGGSCATFPGRRGRIARLPSSIGPIVAKRDALSPRQQILYALAGRPARAARAFRLGLELRTRNVSTPQPLAFIEERPRRLPHQSYLILQQLDGRDLRDWLLRELPSHVEKLPAAELDALKQTLWRALGAAVAGLHAAGFRQRDLKASNLLVNVDNSDSEAPFHINFLDLDGVTRICRRGRDHSFTPERIRTRDVARLLVSLRAPDVAAIGVTEEDATRLITEYLQAAHGRPTTDAELERVKTPATRWAERKIARNRRRRRPVT